MDKQLYLVRHGEVAGRTDTFLGVTDPELSDQGRRQSRWLAERLAEVPFDSCFCSPRLRACQTADMILEKRRTPVRIDPALSEINFGLWEGRTFAEVEADDPHAAQQWCRQPLEFSFPQGDCVATFSARLRTQAQRWRTLPDRHLLLVTHGGVIRTLLALLLDLNAQQQFRFEIRRGSLTTLRLVGDHAVLVGLNDGIE